jgi:hypothetical protein
MRDFSVTTFRPEHLDGIEWQQIVSATTPRGVYRVEVTWALDHYRVTVIRVESLSHLLSHKAWYIRTAVDRANRLLRHYTQTEQPTREQLLKLAETDMAEAARQCPDDVTKLIGQW